MLSVPVLDCGKRGIRHSDCYSMLLRDFCHFNVVEDEEVNQDMPMPQGIDLAKKRTVRHVIPVDI